MIAGRGITHSERFEKARAEGGALHGIQAWVALPTQHEETDPSFAHYDAAALPLHEDGGLRTRLLAGEAFGLRAGVTTHSPLFYAHWEIANGTRAALPDEYSERALYIATGEVEARGQTFGAGKMLVFDEGEDTTDHRVRAGHGHGARRRTRRRTIHRLEFRFIFEGTHRTGQGRLARGPHETPRLRQPGIHPARMTIRALALLLATHHRSAPAPTRHPP